MSDAIPQEILALPEASAGAGLIPLDRPFRGTFLNPVEQPFERDGIERDQRMAGYSVHVIRMVRSGH